ncbi:hypothetical protein COLO4_29841 [Corchorus olitorius]|uniref:Uncharacterized protein n=1 Tax=Corchorus olitorius TaxID=93759 RepID=A0A1R3HD01_9ROSI|nr:hypothetical protein COLO4_29841 [Corchorus olitorius]
MNEGDLETDELLTWTKSDTGCNVAIVYWSTWRKTLENPTGAWDRSDSAWEACAASVLAEI